MSSTTESTVKPKQRKGPYHVVINGLHACLRPVKQPRNIRSMLVSHAFVDLWRMIEFDQSFEKSLFNQLDEQERDYMRYLMDMTKIKNREFDSAYNELLDGLVKRLKMLQGANDIGDDNPNIKKEMVSIIDTLYQKGAFTVAFHNQLKRALA